MIAKASDEAFPELHVGANILCVDPLGVRRHLAWRLDCVATPLEEHPLVGPHSRVVRHRHHGSLEVNEVQRVLDVVQDLAELGKQEFVLLGNLVERPVVVL